MDNVDQAPLGDTTAPSVVSNKARRNRSRKKGTPENGVQGPKRAPESGVLEPKGTRENGVQDTKMAPENGGVLEPKGTHRNGVQEPRGASENGVQEPNSLHENVARELADDETLTPARSLLRAALRLWEIKHRISE